MKTKLLAVLFGVTALFGVLAFADTDFDYEFGRAVKPGEMTYTDYRRIHGEEAANRYGFKAEDVEDGMDTWHWWVGVDNPGFWRDMAKLTGAK